MILLERMYFFPREKCWAEDNLLSNIIPWDVKLPTCDWNLVVRVWGQCCDPEGKGTVTWDKINLQSVIASVLYSSAFVTITLLFHCLYNTKITFMDNSLTLIRPVLADQQYPHSQGSRGRSAISIQCVSLLLLYLFLLTTTKWHVNAVWP